MPSNKSKNNPIINCHTHIFKGEHVPPYLAKTFVPGFLSKLLNTPLILRLLRKTIHRKNKIFTDPFIEKRRNKILRKVRFQRNKFLSGLITLLNIIVTIHVLFIIFRWLWLLFKRPDNSIIGSIIKLQDWLLSHYLLVPINNIWLQIALVIVLILFIKSGRKFLWFLLKKSIRILAMIPGAMTKDLLSRYVLLGRFTLYKNQGRVFQALKEQYAPGSKFIVLPMDMEFMDAGKLNPEFSYPKQMEELNKLKTKSTNKKAILPFVFADPRRIRADENELKFTFKDGKVTLQDSFIKDYLIDKKFDGIKIYPALGYYPFDESLLALWKYAADNQIPIMTHCIKGTIFYRGAKKKEWEQHPIFQEIVNEKENIYKSLLLPQQKNKDFSINFTHPLNYLILLKEELLRIWVEKCGETTKELFGFTDADTPLKYNLNHLKICFAHFGGEDQWRKYMESDRYGYSNEIIKHPDKGIGFLYNAKHKFSWRKLEDCWKYVDWYSIICSMILQSENVYADISYILHDPEIFPLLKQSINNNNMGKKVLFGTDFYVVRNHSAEKNLVAEITGSLSKEEFDKIARVNPVSYLNRSVKD